MSPKLTLGSNILLTGIRGTGKSHLLAAIAETAASADILSIRIPAGAISSNDSLVSHAEVDDDVIRARRVLVDAVAYIANSMTDGLAMVQASTGQPFLRAEAAVEALVRGLLEPAIRGVTAVSDTSATVSQDKSRNLKAELRSLRLEAASNRGQSQSKNRSVRIEGEVSDQVSLELLRWTIETFIEGTPFSGICIAIDEAEHLRPRVQQLLISALVRAVPADLMTLIVSARRGGLWISDREQRDLDSSASSDALNLAAAFDTLIDLDVINQDILETGAGGAFVDALMTSEGTAGWASGFNDSSLAASLVAAATQCNPRRALAIRDQCIVQDRSNAEVQWLLALLSREYEMGRSVANHSVAAERLLRRLEIWAVETGNRRIAVDRGTPMAVELALLADAGVLFPTRSDAPGVLTFDISPSVWFWSGFADFPTITNPVALGERMLTDAEPTSESPLEL